MYDCELELTQNGIVTMQADTAIEAREKAVAWAESPNNSLSWYDKERLAVTYVMVAERQA